MGFRSYLEAGWIGFEPLQDLEYVDLNIIAQVLEQSIKLPLPNSTGMVGRMRSEKMGKCFMLIRKLRACPRHTC